MDPKQFAALEQKVLDIIPTNGISLSKVVVSMSGDDYSKSDVKAAILGLKALGNIQLDDDGTIHRK